MFGLTGALTGIVLMAIGVFLAFFFPTTEEHQPENWAFMMIGVGLVMMVAGFYITFF